MSKTLRPARALATQVCAMLAMLLNAQGILAKQSTAGAEDAPATIRQMLLSKKVEQLYSHTYWNLRDREQADGFLPESVTGAYQGMFPRTVGAYALLMVETKQYGAAEKSLDCVLRALRQNHYERVPRIITKRMDSYVVEDNEAQIDAQAHLILGWARLVALQKHSRFENRTWNQVRSLMSSATDRPYLQYGPYPSQNGLVLNIAFEHSREGRYWQTWDLLTQSFMGAALQEMIHVAESRQDRSDADLWKKRLHELKAGILKQLTIERSGSLTYLEMRLPNSAAGTPYLGMGWVVLSPLAAGWTPSTSILDTTILLMQKQLKNTNGKTWMPTDGYSDGTFSNEIIGKGQAWEMEYARTHGEWQRLEQILDLVQDVNAAPLYMEGARLESPRYHLSSRLTNADLPGLEDAVWKVEDAGNGEQSTWFCWEMARLRKQFGLPAEPERPSVATQTMSVK